jgi:hypothetical protein
MQKLELTYLGRYHHFSGDLAYYTTPDGQEQARVYVDSIGQTWVDIRRIPEGKYFHTERVRAYRALNGSVAAGTELRSLGYTERRIAPYAHRVVEREDG